MRESEPENAGVVQRNPEYDDAMEVHYITADPNFCQCSICKEQRPFPIPNKMGTLESN